ncbi:type IV pilus assembly protein PilW [Pseudoalteromonas rubra]|uniref:Type IV pilus assembly protein PilW n=1 Tax=Pseudoalteromonas rubra TaxID=43658 RepID=A0A8T0C7G7_9GAMM|nr:PilW family protein [Pseudoalteromonas rubra]KAF7786704.1 type IV pilus assembly protein PilW [Pseudoalteromonas rubra]
MMRSGFTLVELLISMFIGALLLGGVVTAYVSMKVTTRDTMAIGELQEVGRLTLTLLRRDLEQVGFWGTFYDKGLTSANSVSPANPSNDCFGGLNNGSFPNAVQTNFRSIYAEKTSGAALSCISGAKNNTEVLQLKFLEGRQITDDNDVENNRYYFIAQQEQGTFVAGNSYGGQPTNNSTLWPYSHHAYYIEEQPIRINSQTITTPILMRRRLTVSGGMTTEAVIEGVEDIRYLFGLDTNGDSRVDTYRSTQDMTASDWERSGGILTVQIIALVRVLEADAGLELKSQTYTLGNDPDRRTLTFNDNYRRTVFSTTIQLYNMGISTW